MPQPPDASVGGQAVIEGVMIRSPHAWSVAIRRGDGEIEARNNDLPRLSARSRWAKVPFVRGVLVLGESLVIGFRALSWSAQKASEGEEDPRIEKWEKTVAEARGPFSGYRKRRAEKKLDEATGEAPELTKGHIAAALGMALLLFIVVFMLAPLGAARLVERLVGESNVLFHVVEGVVRVALFVGYIWIIGRSAEIRRVFQYHGAEHKSIHAYEAGDPLTVTNVQHYRTMHPRCGTSFLLIVILLAVLVFTIIGIFEPSTFWLIASRIIFIPVIAGISYELLKVSAKSRWLHFVSRPGIELQRLTTKEPDDGQVEVAIASLLASLNGESLEEVKGRGEVCAPALAALPQ